LTDPEELEYIGIREYLKPKSLQLIEWPELGKGALEKADISIILSGNGNTRNTKITFQTDIGQSIKECAFG
jgi:tRNA threonylcarbamoyladenosine biosynthesis protein TsaE